MAEKTFAELGRIEAVRQLFGGTGYSPFEEPLFYESGNRDFVTSAQVLMTEGVDFDLTYFPLKHLGRKAVVAATGELYAVMARPATLSVSLSVSAKLDFEQIKELWSGIVSAAHNYGYKSLSLKLQPSRNGLVIALSAVGSCSKLDGTRRPKAQSKDLVCVSGSLGAAYLGLQVLEREKLRFNAGAASTEEMEKYKMLVGAYLSPEIPLDVPAQLSDAGIYPSMGYFVDKGLADALLRLKRDSGLGVKVYADKIPFEGGSFELGKILDADPVSAAMNGGEDYKLLFTIPILQLEKFRKDFQAFDIIGHLALPEAGAALVTPDGVELTISAQGWNVE